MIPNRGAPRGRTLQGHGAPREHHGGDTGGQRSAPQILLVLALPPAAVPRAPVPHFQPKTQLLGHQAPPPGPAGGQGPPVPERVPTPRYPDAPRSPGSACCEVCRQRGGKKIWGGGGTPGPLWGLQLPTPCSLPHTFMPRSRGKRSDPTEMLEPGGTNSHVLLQNTARSPAEHPLGTEGGG